MTNTFPPTRPTTAAALLLGLALALGTPATAQTPGSDQRLAVTDARATRQDGRIDAGVEAGRINASEAARLDAQQTRVDTRTDRLAADGHYSRRDYASVSAQQKRGRQNIAVANRNRR